MNVSELMNLYYRYERANACPFNAQKVTNQNTTKIVTPRKTGSFIAGYKISTDNIRQAIQDEIDYFTEQRKSFEWKVYGTDEPSYLPTELVALGFTPDDPEAFMIKELKDLEFDTLPQKGTIKQVANEAGVNDVIQVSEQVWETDFSSHRQDLIERLQSTPDQISLYVAYENDLPVSSAWITYTPEAHSQVCGEALQLMQPEAKDIIESCYISEQQKREREGLNI